MTNGPELIRRIVLPMVKERSREPGDAWDQAAQYLTALRSTAPPAVEAEVREQCARIVEAERDKLIPNMNPEYVLERAAAAIRSGAVAEGDGSDPASTPGVTTATLRDDEVIVPRVPTERMILALDKGLHDKWPNARAMALACWKHMLSALPPRPSTGGM